MRAIRQENQRGCVRPQRAAQGCVTARRQLPERRCTPGSPEAKTEAPTSYFADRAGAWFKFTVLAGGFQCCGWLQSRTTAGCVAAKKGHLMEMGGIASTLM